MSLSRRSDAWRRAARAAFALLATVVATMSLVARAEADTTAPAAPAGVSVSQGPSWTADNHFDVWWNTPPGQDSPIAIAHYQLCPAVPLGPCSNHRAEGQNISEVSIDLPVAGWYWLRVWLEDTAGNANPNNTSPPVMLRFDDGVPPEAFLDYDGRWLSGATPVTPSFLVEIAATADWPISGVRGYSITLDGSIPDGNVEVYADQDFERFKSSYSLQELPEGITMVRLRSVSNAGVSSDVVGSTHVRLDRSPPTLPSNDVAPEDIWHRQGVAVEVRAEDQADLSGMGAAPLDRPVGEGGYVELRLDGGAVERVRGDRALVEVAGDGRHTLVYRAFDAAGNASVEKEAGFKIDGTAPRGSFRPLDPSDPRTLEVDVADATSGVAGGRIEYRRVGAGDFTRVATSYGGGTLSARLDDGLLAAGRYELRAVVTDVAGNEAVIDRWADGSTTALSLPLRTATNLSVAIAKGSRSCVEVSKPKRRGKAKSRQEVGPKRCRRPARLEAPLAVPHGKRLSSTGRLVAGRDVPVVDGAIVVEGQPRSGGPFVALGMARTDKQGSFRFTIPAGPSQTVRYRYDGTNTVMPAAAQLATKVSAAARLKVSRRKLRNGQAVRFSGRLLGMPVPRGGRVVALQARVGRRWRTFATPRADARGAFGHRYRFRATTGTRRYSFRVLVTREAGYPYETGVSKTVRVTVRGRAKTRGAAALLRARPVSAGAGAAALGVRQLWRGW